MSEVQDVEQSKQVKLKENLKICSSFLYEIIGEECLIGIEKRLFSIQAECLDCSVYRVSNYDLENVYQNLTENREENYYNLIESLNQKKEWRLERFNELHVKFLRERKLMHSNTLNYVRMNSISSQSSRRHIATSTGASPNNLKLKAASNQYSAKLNFSSSFQQQTLSNQATNRDEIEEDKIHSPNKSLNTSQLNQLGQSPHQSQISAIPLNRSFSSSSSSSSHKQALNSSVNQFANKIYFSNQQTIGSIENQKNLINLQNNTNKDVHQDFDPEQYYDRLQKKLKKIHSQRENKYNSQKLNHNKMLNYDGVYRVTARSQVNETDQSKNPANAPIKNFQSIFTPFNYGNKIKEKQYGLRIRQQSSSQIQSLNSNKSMPILKPPSDKMKLNEEDERALQEYYRLNNLPISVVFSKADDEHLQKISSNNNKILERLKVLGIDTPQRKRDQNQSEDWLSPKKNNIIRKSESTGQLNKPISFMALSPSHSNNIKMVKRKVVINKGGQPLGNQNNIHRNSLDQHAFMQNQRKQREEFEGYLKEKQFIETMKSYANIYKVVEMNYLEQHSLKAHQLMKDTMDDMNLIRKFAQQTYKKKKEDNLNEIKKKDFTSSLMKKQKLQQFDKLRQQGIVNRKEINQEDSFEVNNHLEKIAEMQKVIFHDKNDPTGSKWDNYNFGGIKRRKIGVQLCGQLFQPNQIAEIAAKSNENIQEEQHSSSSSPSSHHNISSMQYDQSNKDTVPKISEIIAKQTIEEEREETKNTQQSQDSQNHQKLVNQKTMNVLAQMQKQYKKNLEQPSQKQLEIFQLRNKFQKSAQLRLFKELKHQEESKTENKGLSIFEKKKTQNGNKNQFIDSLLKQEPQKSMDSFIQRGFHRKSNTEYLNNLIFGITNSTKDYNNSNQKDQSSKYSKNYHHASQSTSQYNTIQNLSGVTKPYQHINNTKLNEFSQFNSVWDNHKKQLQFKRIFNYNN